MSLRFSGPSWGRRMSLLFLSAASALVVTAAIASSSAVETSRAAGRSTSAHVWITTADGADKLTDAGTVPFTSAQPSAPTIVVDPTRSFQTMDGFAGAITD